MSIGDLSILFAIMLALAVMPSTSVVLVVTHSGLLGNLLAGLLLTLGDVKAILFYTSIFPLVMQNDQLAAVDVVAVMAVTITSVGGLKLLYAMSARKLATMVQDRSMRRIGQRGAGVLLVGAGGSLIVSTAG